MANQVLIQQSAAVGSFPSATFPSSHGTRMLQFNPQLNAGFTGSVAIEGSNAIVPGNNDFTEILNVTFAGHSQTLALEVQSNFPTIRAVIKTSTNGSIAVFGNSSENAIQGSQGAMPATAVVNSPNRVAGSGNNFSINSVVVPEITSDNVIYENNFAFTLTDVLDGTNGAPGKQDKIGTGEITASEADVNLLAGTAVYGLTTADLEKLADLNASSAELNRLVGATSNIQTQIDTVVASVPSGISGQATTGATIDAFFNATPTVTISDLNAFTGLTASAADLNVFTGSSGEFAFDDLVKLGDIQSSAAEISSLSGFTGTSTDLNRIVGLSTSNADINAISGLAGTGVTATQLGFLSGLTENVQTALGNLPSLTGLSASVNDLNTLTGIFAGSGTYPGPITATEIGYLNGVNGNLQTQLDTKREIGVDIGVHEISGASITTTELNYLQGANANIQAQIDAITVGTITPVGGTFTGPIYIANGTAAAPGLGYIAPNNTTGFYLFGANGIGMSVAGTRFVTTDGTDLVVGDGSTIGGPTIKGVGFSTTDPTYTFTGDEDSGVAHNGPDSVAIVAGAETLATFDATNDVIAFGGVVANNNAVVIDGVFAGEKMLGRATLQAGSVTGSVGQTSIYTVPAGRSTIVTKIMVRLANVTNFTDGSLFRMNVGFGASFDELVDNTNNPTIFNPIYAFDTAAQVMPLGMGDNTFPAISGSSGADYQVLAAGADLQADVTVVAGADTYDLELIVFGHEYA